MSGAFVLDEEAKRDRSRKTAVRDNVELHVALFINDPWRQEDAPINGVAGAALLACVRVLWVELGPPSRKVVRTARLPCNHHAVILGVYEQRTGGSVLVVYRELNELAGGTARPVPSSNTSFFSTAIWSMAGL